MSAPRQKSTGCSEMSSPAKNAIVLVSSDIDELVGLSDCILVLRDREMVEEFPQHPAEKKDVLAAIVGSRQHRHPHATDDAS